MSEALKARYQRYTETRQQGVIPRTYEEWLENECDFLEREYRAVCEALHPLAQRFGPTAVRDIIEAVPLALTAIDERDAAAAALARVEAVVATELARELERQHNGSNMAIRKEARFEGRRDFARQIEAAIKGDSSDATE